MITRVQRLSIPVLDQDRAKRFYMDVLGLELLNDVPTGDASAPRWLELAPAGGGPSLVLVCATATAGGLDGLMLETGDVDRACEQIRRRGVAVVGPRERVWGREATLTDPDGNGIVLVEARAAGPYHATWLAHRYTTAPTEVG
jgi:predicted enzyme related to lactoylglutathione lyase